jgi:hypothetical protein
MGNSACFNIKGASAIKNGGEGENRSAFSQLTFSPSKKDWGGHKVGPPQPHQSQKVLYQLQLKTARQRVFTLRENTLGYR